MRCYADRRMSASPFQQLVTLRPVDKDNWRAVASLEVTQEQSAFVAPTSYYLALCCYDIWNPLAVGVDDRTVGFMMWAIDDDRSCWLGGILLDYRQQGQGYGKKAVSEAVAMLREETGSKSFALSYRPDNVVARRLYRSLNFVETGEREGDEIVARKTVA